MSDVTALPRKTVRRARNNPWPFLFFRNDQADLVGGFVFSVSAERCFRSRL